MIQKQANNKKEKINLQIKIVLELGLVNLNRPEIKLHSYLELCSLISGRVALRIQKSL